MSTASKSSRTVVPRRDLKAMRDPGRSTVSDSVASFTRRYRWLVVALWLVALAAAGSQALTLRNSLSGGGWWVPGSASAAAASQLREGFTGRGATTVTLVVRDTRHVADDPDFAARVGEVARTVRQHPALKVASEYGWSTLSAPANSGFLGADRRTAIEFVGLRLDDGTARRVLPEVQAELTKRYEPTGLRVSLVSQASLFGEVNALSEQGLAVAELITFPLILVILLLLYRNIVAALVSLVVGATAVVVTLGLLALVARRHELSLFVQNSATMLGLGVGVDYSLFMISRFTGELRTGCTVDHAVARTLRTSGETVVASGITIAMAMSALFLVRLNVIQSLALGAVVVVGFAILASVVVLPAFLHLLGRRMVRKSWRSLRSRGPVASGATSSLLAPLVSPDAAGHEPGGRRWAALARMVMRRPVLFLVISLVGLLALGAPALRISTFTPDVRIVPTSSPVRAGYDAVRDQFGIGQTSPIQVVVESSTPLDTRDDTALLDLHDRLVHLKGVVRVNSALDALKQVNPAQPYAALAPATFDQLPPDVKATVRHFVRTGNRVTVLELVPDGYASSTQVRDLVNEVRKQTAATIRAGGWRVVVGGETAEGVDANRVIEDQLPLVVAIMLVAIYLVLLVTFRSLFLPLKAIVSNLLSVGATYGVLVVCFQDGWLAGVLGFDSGGNLTNFVPIVLVTLLFSLSTDYEVFLLSRVREEYLATGDNVGSVATGLARTAPLISGAAVLMVAVFAAFTFTSILPIQQLGLGMAVAITLDATVLRLLVVPASMRLMARWNWWMPGRRSRPTVLVATPASRVRAAAVVPARPAVPCAHHRHGTTYAGGTWVKSTCTGTTYQRSPRPGSTYVASSYVPPLATVGSGGTES
jgi:putative drug exporter of the RND superfamily